MKWLLTITALSLTILATASTDAVTLTVSNVNDNGVGSLRQAILDANGNTGLDTITFNIGAGGPQTIIPQSALPKITDPTIIDGTSQPGFAGIPIIQLNGVNAGGLADGLSLATNCVVRGLIVNRFGRDGIVLIGSGNLVAGNFIGTDATGSVALGNGRTGVLIYFASNNTIGGTALSDRNVISGNLGPAGIDMVSSSGNLVQGNFIGTDRNGTAAVGNASQGVQINSSQNNMIGGITPGARNVISGNTGGVNIVFSSATGNFVQGNFIGTDVSGAAALGNGSGVQINNDASNNTIGGTVPGARNIISGNGEGITISGVNASNNLVQGNFIGTDVTGVNALGNTFSGLTIVNASNTVIGGTVNGSGNIIAHNGSVGVNISFNARTNNAILGNAIFDSASLGIDLGGDGVTANDPGDADTGSNNLQNYPVLTSAASGGGNTSIAGTLNSVANTTYRIEFFANDTTDPSGFGEGQSFVGFTNASTDPNGNVSFIVSVPQIAAGRQVTATATDPNGNTSEFSAAVVPGPPVITSPLVATGTAGLPFTYQFEATGATSLGVSSLPAGLVFNANLAAITGKPATAGTFNVGLSASNSQGTTNATLTLTVQPPPPGPVIISSTCATGRTGRAFSFQLQTSGGSSATRFMVNSLPPGLELDPSTGFISGTPTSDGSFSLAVSAIDGAAITQATVQLTFTSNPTVPIITSAGTVVLTPGQSFSYTITADANATFGYIGSDGVVHQGPSSAGLPAGLSFDGINTISGTFNGGPIISGKTETADRSANGGPGKSPDQTGGIITNVQLFATDPGGTGTFPLISFIAAKGAVNISTRLAVGTGNDVLIGGFIINGTGTTKALIRAIGPSLTQFGVPNALQDPILELKDVNGVTLGSNDNWRDSQENAIVATAITPSADQEAAVLAYLSPGHYTAILSGKNNTTGIALVEVYDLGVYPHSLDDARLANISTRGFVDTGDSVIIGGFIIRPQAPATTTRVLVRAIGPSLSAFGISGALPDPTLELKDADGTTLVSNDDWQLGPSADTKEIQNLGFAPSDSRESALITTLPSGQYTGIVRGKDNGTGVALVEVYGLE